jgi:hypothetical protein
MRSASGGASTVVTAPPASTSGTFANRHAAARVGTSLRGSRLPTCSTNAGGRSKRARTASTASAGGGWNAAPGASCTTVASRPKRARTRSAVNPETAMTASADVIECRTVSGLPSRFANRNAPGSSNSARSWTVVTVGAFGRSGSSTSSPWTHAAAPTGRRFSTMRRTPVQLGRTCARGRIATGNSPNASACTTATRSAPVASGNARNSSRAYVWTPLPPGLSAMALRTMLPFAVVLSGRSSPPSP